MWKNKKGTSPRQCNCGTWTHHWENYSYNEWPEKCQVLGCSNPPEVGAHIYSTTGNSREERIVPMCRACNANQEEFSLVKGYRTVSANRQLTCD